LSQDRIQTKKDEKNEVKKEALWESISELWAYKKSYKKRVKFRPPFLTLLGGPWEARGSDMRCLCSGLYIALFSKNPFCIGFGVDFRIILGGSGRLFRHFWGRCFWSDFWRFISPLCGAGRRQRRSVWGG